MFLNRNRHTSGIHSSKCEMMELLDVSYCRDFLPKLRRGGWVFVLNILFDAIHNLTKWAKESIIIKSCSSRVLPGVCRLLSVLSNDDGGAACAGCARSRGLLAREHKGRRVLEQKESDQKHRLSLFSFFVSLIPSSSSVHSSRHVGHTIAATCTYTRLQRSTKGKTQEEEESQPHTKKAASSSSFFFFFKAYLYIHINIWLKSYQHWHLDAGAPGASCSTDPCYL